MVSGCGLAKLPHSPPPRPSPSPLLSPGLTLAGRVRRAPCSTAALERPSLVPGRGAGIGSCSCGTLSASALISSLMREVRRRLIRLCMCFFCEACSSCSCSCQAKCEREGEGEGREEVRGR